MQASQFQSNISSYRKRILWSAVLLSLVWVFLIWQYENFSFQQRTYQLIDQEQKRSNVIAQGVAADLQRSLKTMQGVPFVLAQNKQLAQALKSVGAEKGSSESAIERKQRIRRQNQDDRWVAINQTLTDARDHLGFDLAYLLDRYGDCLASSEQQLGESLIGNNYRERTYYKAAISGNAGYQFALGKTSKTPGLYFSAPIYDGESIIGVVTAKIDISRLAQDIDLAGVFLIDENGVIILAQDKQQEMKALQASAVFTLPSEKRKSLYGRDEFALLEIRPLTHSQGLVQLDQSSVAYVMGGVKLSEKPLEVLHALAVPNIDHLHSEKVKTIVLMVIAGCSVILITLFGAMYLFESNENRKILQTQRDRLNEAQRLAAMGSWSIDIQSQTVNCSDSARWFFSIEHSDTTPSVETIIAAIHVDDKRKVLEALQTAMREHQDFHMAFRIVRPNDEVHFVVGDGVYVQHAESGIESFEGTIRDITEYQMLLNALETSEAHLKKVINSCLIGIIQGREDGRLLGANDAFVQLTGYAESTLLAGEKRWQDLTPLSFHDADQQALNNLNLNAVLPAYEKELICADGRVIPVLVGIARVEENERDWVAFVLDLSERNRISRLQAEFIAIVSHELRTPLTSIRGSLALLENGVLGALPEKALQMIAVAHRNSKRLSNLVNDILDMEKLNAGKMKFDMHAVDLVSLLPQVIEANAVYAQNFQVGFDLECGVEQAMIWGDPDRLQQVLSNLMSNAAKFSPAGEKVIVRLASSGPRWQVHVIDRGPGIPEEFQAVMFDSFAQADNSDTRQKQGSGLGLKICKSMVELMEGEISFDTSPTHGTNFWISFEKI